MDQIRLPYFLVNSSKAFESPVATSERRSFRFSASVVSILSLAAELINKLLQGNLHRQSSDPSGVLAHWRSYQHSLKKFGGEDPDTDFLLACVLIRLDYSEHYEYLLERIKGLGSLAFSVLHNVFESIPEHDRKRHGILKQARILWMQMLEATKKNNRKDSSA